LQKPEVTVIDYGVGNLLSVKRGLEHCGAVVTISSDAKTILSSSLVVLPGVGAFGNAMEALVALGLVDVILEVFQRQTPLLGICLGMQLLLDKSDEFGSTKGLGIIPGSVIPIPAKTVSGEAQKIPHIGWTSLSVSDSYANWDNTILGNNVSGDAAYFVHSFMATPLDTRHCIADCYYGGHKVVAVIQRDNTIGCQFHPEKSGNVGLNILKNFVLQLEPLKRT